VWLVFDLVGRHFPILTPNKLVFSCSSKSIQPGFGFGLDAFAVMGIELKATIRKNRLIIFSL